ncbi:MAG TPA: hypothetical protein VN538_12630 [Clostridia bacterium]|nr:hypothetical protein [Clostridia bacterium]
MPRIYAQNESHAINFGGVEFIAGVAALAADASTDYFDVADRHYTVDGSKHKLELWDRMTVTQLDELYVYLGGTPSSEDAKYAKVRKIETLLSTKLIATLAVASEAGTAEGDTKITITTPGTATYFAKTGLTDAPALLYGDVPDDTWTQLTLVAGVTQFTPGAANHDKLGTVRVNAAGAVDAIASDALVVNAGG